MARIMTVLRHGGIYTWDWVWQLAWQLDQVAPGRDLWVLTDRAPDEVKQANVKWIVRDDMAPGWWSKMTLFYPTIGDCLFMDLDTFIFRDPQYLIDIAQDCPVALRDYNKPDRLGSGLMYIPQRFKKHVWRRWQERRDYWMEFFHDTGDQMFLTEQFGDYFLRWQDLCAVSYVPSWKVTCGGDPGRIPRSAVVLCFHGKPKPDPRDWESTWRAVWERGAETYAAAG